MYAKAKKIGGGGGGGGIRSKDGSNKRVVKFTQVKKEG